MNNKKNLNNLFTLLGDEFNIELNESNKRKIAQAVAEDFVTKKEIFELLKSVTAGLSSIENISIDNTVDISFKITHKTIDRFISEF